jgi:hypothetical protein
METTVGRETTVIRVVASGDVDIAQRVLEAEKMLEKRVDFSLFHPPIVI